MLIEILPKYTRAKMARVVGVIKCLLINLLLAVEFLLLPFHHCAAQLLFLFHL